MDMHWVLTALALAELVLGGSETITITPSTAKNSFSNTSDTTTTTSPATTTDNSTTSTLATNETTAATVTPTTANNSTTSTSATNETTTATVTPTTANNATTSTSATIETTTTTVTPTTANNSTTSTSATNETTTTTVTPTTANNSTTSSSATTETTTTTVTPTFANISTTSTLATNETTTTTVTPTTANNSTTSTSATTETTTTTVTPTTANNSTTSTSATNETTTTTVTPTTADNATTSTSATTETTTTTVTPTTANNSTTSTSATNETTTATVTPTTANNATTSTSATSETVTTIVTPTTADNSTTSTSVVSETMTPSSTPTNDSSTMSAITPPPPTTTIRPTTSTSIGDGNETTFTQSISTTTSDLTTTIQTTEIGTINSTTSTASVTSESTTNRPSGTFPVEDANTKMVFVSFNFTLTINGTSLNDVIKSELLDNLTTVLTDIIFPPVAVTLEISFRTGSIICEIKTTTTVAILINAGFDIETLIGNATDNLQKNKTDIERLLPEVDLNSTIESMKEYRRTLNYNSSIGCPKSYKYHPEGIECLHACDYYEKHEGTPYCQNNGECFYDIISGFRACRCKESSFNVYHGPICEHKTANISFVLAMSLGIGCGILVAAAIIIRTMCVRRPRKGKQTMSCCKRSDERGDDYNSTLGDWQRSSSRFGESAYENFNLQNFSIRRPTISDCPNPLYRRNSGSLQGDAMDLFDYSLHQDPKRNPWQ